MLDFKFSNTLLHFPRSDAPGGFFWKYGLSYVLAGVLIGGVSLLILRPIIEAYIEMFALANEGGEAASEEAINAIFVDRLDSITRSSLLLMAVLLPLALAVWAVFEACLQRHYIRKDRFRLRFGNDEGRLMAVGLVVAILYTLLSFLGLIPMMIVVGIFASSGNEFMAVIGVIVGYFVLFAILLWYGARISAATALTIRDERIKIFESFRVTKGRTLRIMGALLIIWVLYYIIQTIIYASGIFAVMAQFGNLIASDTPEASEVMAQLQAPGVIGTIAAFMTVLVFTYGVTLIFLGGPGALATLNDPDRAFDGTDPADVFD